MKTQLHNLGQSIRDLLGLSKSHIENNDIHVTMDDKNKIKESFLHSTDRSMNADLNTFVSPGIYPLGSPLINGPTNGDWGVLTVKVSGDVITQTVENHSGRVFYRTKSNNTNWATWNVIADPSVNIPELFQSVSSGKGLIAAATTQKGITTNATDTFAVMAANIDKISTGGKKANGSALASNATMSFLNSAGGLASHYYLELPVLDFIPSIVWVFRADVASDSTFFTKNYFLNYGGQTANIAWTNTSVKFRRGMTNNPVVPVVNNGQLYLWYAWE